MSLQTELEPQPKPAPIKCEECGRINMTLMVEMEPGLDGKPWHLCRRCFCSGLRTKEEQARLDAKLEKLKDVEIKESR